MAVWEASIDRWGSCLSDDDFILNVAHLNAKVLVVLSNGFQSGSVVDIGPVDGDKDECDRSVMVKLDDDTTAVVAEYTVCHLLPYYR